MLNPHAFRATAVSLAFALVIAVTVDSAAAQRAPATATTAPQAASAATAADSVGLTRWSVWLGCWTPSELRPPAKNMRLCVVPNAAGTGVRLVTFAGERLPTVYGGPDRLSALVPVPQLKPPGTREVCVINPDGKRSPPVRFTISSADR